MRGNFIDDYICNPKLWYPKKIFTSDLYHGLKAIIATQQRFFDALQNPSSLAQAKENLSFAKNIIDRASLYIATVHAFMNLNVDVLFHVSRHNRYVEILQRSTIRYFMRKKQNRVYCAIL